MKLDWNRIKRTFIQSAAGAGVAFITAISGNLEKEYIITSLIQFVSTVAVAVLMNIQTQADDQEEDV